MLRTTCVPADQLEIAELLSDVLVNDAGRPRRCPRSPDAIGDDLGQRRGANGAHIRVSGSISHAQFAGRAAMIR